jgi:hypothetical protein
MRALPFVFVAAAMAACGNGNRQDTTPPDAPTQQDYQAQSDGTLKVSWRNPSDKDFAATLVIRYDATSSPDAHPTSGATPSVGAPFGSGVVAFVGAEDSFIDTALPDVCRAYTYQLWSKDTSGNWSVGAAQLQLPHGAGTRTPSSAPTAMTAASVDSDVQLAWTNPPPDTGWNELRVVRKSATAPSGPTDGIAVFTGKGSAAAEPLSGMGSGTWVYAVFACNKCGVCNKSPATVVFSRAVPVSDGGEDGGADAGPEDGGVLTPSGLTVQVSGDGKNVLLSWSNPASVNQVKLVRTLDVAPIGPGDSSAESVFQGNSTNAAERVDKLIPTTPAAPHTYFYRVYGCRNASCETSGAEATLALTVSQALRGGGYTLFWRHATATVCGDQTQLGPASNTTQPDWWKSCDKNCSSAYARQLDTQQSPNETATTHSVFASRGFGVGRVISSEFCRAVETAQGFDFGPSIELSQALTYFVYDEAQRCTNTMQLLNAAPSTGTNTALISHAGFTCPILDSLAWGEAAIYRPSPGGAPSFIARVPWNNWATLP